MKTVSLNVNDSFDCLNIKTTLVLNTETQPLTLISLKIKRVKERDL